MNEQKRAMLDQLHAEGVLTEAAYADAKARIAANELDAGQPLEKTDADRVVPPTGEAPTSPWPASSGSATIRVPSPASPDPAESPPPVLGESTTPADNAVPAVETEPELEELPPVSSQPCPRCGHPSTVVTTATPAAAPAFTVDGDEVPGGATVHLCPQCGAILELFEGDVADAWATVEQRWEDDQDDTRPDVEIVDGHPVTTTTEGRRDATHEAQQQGPLRQEDRPQEDHPQTAPLT